MGGEKVALAKGTSVNALVRNFLDHLGETRLKREESASALESIWKRSRARVGRKTWTRDDLHGR